MGIATNAAKAMGALTTWCLRDVLHRGAGNFPGKVALAIDPQLIANLRERMLKGSVLVVGTNGKTTVTNLLANCLEESGATVACNRDGANLASGVATTLLQSACVDWGVFEIDELWLAKVTPTLRPTYVVLLDLFRDQLDRMGEISTIQQSIARGLAASPRTILIYNADDPNCTAIAQSVTNKSVAFGIQESMGLPHGPSMAAQMCASCGDVLRYAFRQYDQLGDYECPSCGMKRPALDYAASSVTLNAGGLGFDLKGRHVVNAALEDLRMHARWNGAYMVYNVTAVATTALLMGCSLAQVQAAIDAFDPQNGRLQWVQAEGYRTLLNLAKNPTGFEQNLHLALRDAQACAVAFFVNDAEGDGRDPSWLWNVNFEALAQVVQRSGMCVFAGGTRAADVMVRLKYAGVPAQEAATAADVYASLADADRAGGSVYLIANYTALPALRAELVRYAGVVQDGLGARAGATEPAAAAAGAGATESGQQQQQQQQQPVVLLQVLPDLLGVFGDGGNVRVLQQRLAWRGIPVEVRTMRHGDALLLGDADAVVLGGSMGAEQRMAARDLAPYAQDMKDFVAGDGVVLGVCGGYQLLGSTWMVEGHGVSCMGIIDATTVESEGMGRVVGDVVRASSLVDGPVFGFENHMGVTQLGSGMQAQPFATLVSAAPTVSGKPAKDDGVLFRNVLGTYLHGPVLARNPQVADELLRRIVAHWAQRTGNEVPSLNPLDDKEENAVRAYLSR